MTATGVGLTLLGTSAVDAESGIELRSTDGVRWVRAIAGTLQDGWMAAMLEALPVEMTDEEVLEWRLAADEELHRRGFSRSEGALVGEVAEYLAERYLGVTLATNLVNKDYDGVDVQGRRVQIKARVVEAVNRTTSWDFRERPDGFDFLLAFLFGPDLKVLRIMEVPLTVVRERARQNRHRWSFRWNRELARDPRITAIPWPPRSPGSTVGNV